MRRAAWAALVALLAAVLSAVALTEVLPGGELSASEAHVLLTTQSIVEDGDLDVADDLRERAYEDWYDGRLAPLALPTDGRLHERQGVLLPALLAPGWAVGGVDGVRVELCLLLAIALAAGVALAARLVPEPWPLRAALGALLVPPVLAGAGAVGAAPAAAALVGLGAVAALRVREEPGVRPTAAAALCAALLPWLEPFLVLPAAGVALATARWLRRRRRGLAGFVALEVVLVSGVVYITINDRLFGGVTPGAAALPGARGDAAEPWVLALAPAAALLGVAAWRLWRSHHGRLVLLAGEQVHVEVIAAFLLALAAVAVATGVLSGIPELAIAGVAPAMGAAAWAAAFVPRTAAALVALGAGAAVAATLA